MGLFTVVGHTGFWVSVGFGVITLCVNLFCGFGLFGVVLGLACFTVGLSDLICFGWVVVLRFGCFGIFGFWWVSWAFRLGCVQYSFVGVVLVWVYVWVVLLEFAGCVVLAVVCAC